MSSNIKYFIAFAIFLVIVVIGLLFLVPAFQFLGAFGAAVGWLITLGLGAFVAFIIAKK